MKRDLEELKADVKAAKIHSAQSIEFLNKFNMVESADPQQQQQQQPQQQQPARGDEESGGGSSGQSSDRGSGELG